MKPRNKFETYILGLCNTVIQEKPLMQKHKDWAVKTLMNEKYYTTHYSKKYCLSCGELFKADAVKEKCECPSCKGNLKFTQRFYSKEYFGIYDVVDGVQVHRIFEVSEHLSKGKPVYYHFSEVMQFWVNDKGKMAFVSKKIQQSYYYDNFILSSDLEIADKSVMRATNLCINHNYRDKKVMQKQKRNGFVPDKIKFHPAILMVALLTDKLTEFLVKLGQHKIVVDQLRSGGYLTEKIINYKNQIRIATKHGFIIKECGDYFDYLDLLVFFNKDINNPHYLCPKNFTEAHDSLVRAKARIDAAKDRDALQSEFRALDKKYKRRMKKFLNLKSEAEDLVIMVPQSVEEFYDAGVELKHCIYTNNYFDKKNSLLLFTYKDGQIFETTEVDIKTKEIVQSRGYKNKDTKYTRFVKQTIKQNILPLIK